MSRSMLVTRTELSLTDLQLWSPPNSFIVGDTFTPGAQTLRREMIQSPFVRGRFLMGFTQDSQDAQVMLEIVGTSGADLDSRIGVVLDAFGQSSYTVTRNFDGSSSSYLCEPADYTVGDSGRWEDIDIVFHAAPVLLTIPHDPLPVTGTF